MTNEGKRGEMGMEDYGRRIQLLWEVMFNYLSVFAQQNQGENGSQFNSLLISCNKLL